MVNGAPTGCQFIHVVAIRETKNDHHKYLQEMAASLAVQFAALVYIAVVFVRCIVVSTVSNFKAGWTLLYMMRSYRLRFIL